MQPDQDSPNWLTLGVNQFDESWVTHNVIDLKQFRPDSGHRLSSTHEFLLIASDGLWDVVSSAEAVATIRSELLQIYYIMCHPGLTKLDLEHLFNLHMHK